jgi:hypothetical protein
MESVDISNHKALQLVRSAALTVAPNAQKGRRARFGFATLDARGSRKLAKAKHSLSTI